VEPHASNLLLLSNLQRPDRCIKAANLTFKNWQTKLSYDTGKKILAEFWSTVCIQITCFQRPLEYKQLTKIRRGIFTRII
jgi:hypothetical protein